MEWTRLTETCKQRTQQLQAATTENQAQREKLTEHEQTISALRLQFQEKQQEVERINAILVHAKGQLGALQHMVTTLRGGSENAKANIESLKDDKLRLEAHNKQLSDYLALAETKATNTLGVLQEGRKRVREAEQEAGTAAKRTKP